MTRKLVLVGEAYGAEEEKQHVPFVGASGYELTRMLSDAGISRADCYLTNCFNFRPANNDIETLCTTKANDTTGLQPIRPGKYLRKEFLGELDRLHRELADEAPNLVVALGGTAAWALLHNNSISKIRGTIALSYNKKHKVLPVFHPAAVLRDWSLRHVTVLDFIKAKRESEYPEIRRPKRSIFIEPSLGDLQTFYHQHILTSKLIAPDIETFADQITCIGFATSVDTAIVIPFVDHRKPGSNYWPTLEEEVAAWEWVRKYLLSSARKVFQNGIFDCGFLLRAYGLTVNNADEDTMLLHHSLQPESLKGLGFLGSVYTSESSWKLMRSKTIKRDA